MWKRLLIAWVILVGLAGVVAFIAGPTTAGTSDIDTADRQSSDSPINVTEVEREIAHNVNDARAANGAERLGYDAELADIAADHSDDMASNNFLSHNGSDSQTMTDRYDSAGYECRVPIAGDRYVPGGENIAQSWYQTELSNGTIHMTETELANAVVNNWLDSPPHRDNLLADYWTVQGIGVAVTHENQVYVTQNFC